MREYTTIITITVIASTMADSEEDAEMFCRGPHPDDPSVYHWSLPTLVHPQIIGLTAYSPVSVGHDGFKARSFKEAAREFYPEIEPDCEARPIVFPPEYPGLPK